MQNTCFMCKNQFSIDDNDKKHHCHYNGKYSDAAHNACNLRYKMPKEIPLVMVSNMTIIL